MVGLVGQVWIGAYDNIEEFRGEMRNKRAHATIEQHPELMGAFGVELAAKALSGEEIPRDKSTPLDLITYESFEKIRRKRNLLKDICFCLSVLGEF